MNTLDEMFEEWATDRGYSGERSTIPGRAFISDFTEQAYRGWLACAEKLLSRAPSEVIRKALLRADSLPWPSDGDAIKQEWDYVFAAYREELGMKS